MEIYGFGEITGTPFRGRNLEKLRKFLKEEELDYDEKVEYTYVLQNQTGDWAGTGSIDGNVLKCIAVNTKYQGEGLLAKILTNLTAYALKMGRTHLFLFTKPKNQVLFEELGFYVIAQTEDVVLMENKKDGIKSYMQCIKEETSQQLGESEGMAKQIGAVIANCNPFTLGHLYLLETAAKQCDLLHVFILSSEERVFPAKVRYALVKSATAKIPNLVLHKTEDYLISPATFPTYFMKEKGRAKEINCGLDIAVFVTYIAKELGITKRFVGTEPTCAVTRSYNEQLKERLVEHGIEVIEIPRKECDGIPVSASSVRALMAEGNWMGLKRLVPPSTYEFLISEEGRQIAEALRVRN